MLPFLLLALAAVQTAPAVPDPANAPPDSATPGPPGSPNVIEGDFRILDPGPKQQDMIYASAGALPHFLAVGCDRGDGGMSVLASLNANVGYSMPGGLMGGQRVRYTFDGGREQSNRWAGVGDAVIARAAASRPLEFIRGLRGSRSVRLRVEASGNVAVDVTFRYADPTAVIDEVLRRCGVTLEEPRRR
jgi:hypothetical protein